MSVVEHHDVMAAAGSFNTPGAISVFESIDDPGFSGLLTSAAVFSTIATFDAFGGIAINSGTVPGIEYPFDPYAASFVGEITHRDLIPISSAARAAILIQANGPSGAAFQFNDILSAQWYPWGNSVPTFTPLASFFTAGGTQTGWPQAQLAVNLTTGMASLLQPSVVYVLDVFRAPYGEPANVDLVATFRFIARSPWQP